MKNAAENDLPHRVKRPKTVTVRKSLYSTRVIALSPAAEPRLHFASGVPIRNGDIKIASPKPKKDDEADLAIQALFSLSITTKPITIPKQAANKAKHKEMMADRARSVATPTPE